MIDFREALARRRQVKYDCMGGCGRTVTKETAHLVVDDAEVYIVCENCKPKFEARKRHRCEKCGRSVITVYPDASETHSVCAICKQEEAKTFDPDGPDDIDLPDDENVYTPPREEDFRGPFPDF